MVTAIVANNKAGTSFVGELLALVAKRNEESQHRIAKQKATEQARREKEQAEERARHLDQLASHKTKAWQKVDNLIAMRHPSGYDQAVTLMVDLRDVAVRGGEDADFYAHISRTRSSHSRKPNLMARLDNVGLLSARN